VGVAASAKAAVQAGLPSFQEGLATENQLNGQLFQTPIAAERTRQALAAGAQTRAGERDLEGLLSSL